MHGSPVYSRRKVFCRLGCTAEQQQAGPEGSSHLQRKFHHHLQISLRYLVLINGRYIFFHWHQSHSQYYFKKIHWLFLWCSPTLLIMTGCMAENRRIFTVGCSLPLCWQCESILWLSLRANSVSALVEESRKSQFKFKDRQVFHANQKI